MAAVFIIAAVPAYAATYYISPNGSNSAPGTSAAPWKTFPFALSKLNPGDTLIVKDGTYTRQQHGNGTVIIPVFCQSGVNSGTASAPITVRAENERVPLLKGDGIGGLLHVYQCSYWNFEGLRGMSADSKSDPHVGNFLVYEGDHISFRRNLLSHSNRWRNQAMITYNHSDYGLIEENEIYSYHRHGFTLSASSNAVIRRNYANSRGYPSLGALIPSGEKPGYSDRADSMMVVYPGSNNILENNISEGNGTSFDVQAAGWHGVLTKDNKWCGNISLNDAFGAVFVSRPPGGIKYMPQNNYLENHITIDPIYNGTYLRANKNTLCRNCTTFGGVAGFNSDKPPNEGDGAPTIYYENSLAVGAGGSYGFSFNDQSDFGVKNSNAYGYSRNYSPSSHSGYNNTMSVDPQLGSCKVFIPDSSPMKGAGANGDDIGGSVLCRYENCTLTDQQLWDWASGSFPCGAIIPGVNDVPGKSCFDVHKRLNVNANGCTLPANPTCKQPSGVVPGGSPGGIGTLDLKDINCIPAGQPKEMGITLPPGATGTVLIAGLRPGFTLSAGQPMAGTNGAVWEVPVSQIPGLTMIPPAGFNERLELSITVIPDTAP